MNKRQRKKLNKQIEQFITAMKASFLTIEEATKIFNQLRDAALATAAAMKRIRWQYADPMNRDPYRRMLKHQPKTQKELNKRKKEIEKDFKNSFKVF